MTRGQRPEVPDNLPPVTHLWTTGDIAREMNATPPEVCNWARRYDTFPQPVAAQWGRRFYDPDEIRQWCAATGHPRPPRVYVPCSECGGSRRHFDLCQWSEVTA